MKKLFLIVLLFFATIFPHGGVASAQRDEFELSVRLPVIMYHSVLNGRTGRYIVSESQLEADLAALRKEGYTAVSAEQVIAYAGGKGFLPEKPVLITFDDGHYNNLYYAVPLLNKYDMPALFNIVGGYSEYSTTSGDCDNPNYSHLTWDEIGALHAGGLISFGSHSYNMHKFSPRYGIAKKRGESDAAYKKALREDTLRLNEKLFEACGQYPATYAYPFGKYTEEARQILSELGFKLFLTCNEGVSVVAFNKPETLYQIKRVNREGKYSSTDLLKRIA